MSNIPKLRFPEFTDAWEKCKLINIADRVTRKNKKLESKLPLTISAQDGLISQNEFFNKQIASKDVSGYYLLKKGEFAYNKSYSNGYPWGAIKRLDKYEMGVVSTLYICFSLKDHINSDFITTYYDTHLWYKEISQISAEGARNHGLLNIATEDFFQTSISLPTLPEQQKIGNLFKQLDRLITLHKRKWDDVILLKKALLQKMFPKNGSDFPEIRFPEFTDAWEKCKLGDVAEFINGKAYKQEELLNEGKYKVVRVGNFNTNEHWYYSNLELENNKYMVAGDLLYLWATDFGPKFWAGEKAIFHYHIWKLELNYKIIDKNYLYVWLETDKEKIKQSTNGTTMVHVTKSTMEKRVLSFPTLPEQQKIGTLFRRLDRLITLHKRQHEHYQLLKKALLQQMFV